MNEKPMMTGLFPDRESAEQGYNALTNRGYTSDDVNLVRGSHQIGFGVQKRYLEFNQRSASRTSGSWTIDGSLTGHALADHSREAREAGCDAFLTKPCLPAALVQEIERMLGANRKKTSQKRG